MRFFGRLALLVAALAALASPGLAEPERVVVLTAHPAAHAIASALAAGSIVEVKPVQPAKLPASRLASFLSGRGAAALHEAALGADAVVTFRSFWPEDPLYPHARRANIRIVEIDAGRPLDGALPGIAILAPADDRETYAALDLSPMPPSGEGAAPWLSPTALGRMADVVAADLERLAPAAREKIAANLAQMKRRLIAAKAKADAALAEAPSVTAFALSGRYGYLAADLGLELVASITAAPTEWTRERAEKLRVLLQANDVAIVLADAELDPEMSQAIAEAGAKIVTPVEEANDPVEAIEGNLARLTETLGR
jgi:CheY-like chemotaxis protein